MEFLCDGKKLAVPTTPIRCSNANGLTDQIRYQVYAPLKEDSTLRVKRIPGMELVKISPIVEGRATIVLRYKGQEKIFLIN